MRIVVLDTYYPDFLRSLSPIEGTYEEDLAKLLSMGFGTFDAYSHYLKALGHEVIDIIANYRPLQDKAAQSFGWGRGASLQSIAIQQIKRFVPDGAPDVVIMQDLSFFSPAVLSTIANNCLLVGQCSCPLPLDDTLRRYHVIFSSLPNHVEHFRKLGVRAEYLPLAFDPRMLQYQSETRDIDISFVGGVGKNSHWHKGTKDLESLASVFPSFAWYGYGLENLDENSPLRRCWRGFAWGRQMYEIYGRSKLVVNRHGEIAQGHANNLRMYEATGMGACLLTDNSTDLFGVCDFGSYGEDSGIISEVHHLINEDPEWAASIAKMGQERTLQHHTYAHRMQRVSEVLTECLKSQPSIA